MLERNFGDNTVYTLTVDEMAGVYDMLEESHFPKAVTYTFLVEWFESVRCFDTAEKICELLDICSENENKLMKHMYGKCEKKEAEDVPYTDMRPFDPSADVEPVKHAKWEQDKCTNCGKSLEDLFEGEFYYDRKELHFCPNCGARMED